MSRIVRSQSNAAGSAATAIVTSDYAYYGNGGLKSIEHYNQLTVGKFDLAIYEWEYDRDILTTTECRSRKLSLLKWTGSGIGVFGVLLITARTILRKDSVLLKSRPRNINVDFVYARTGEVSVRLSQQAWGRMPRSLAVGLSLSALFSIG